VASRSQWGAQRAYTSSTSTQERVQRPDRVIRHEPKRCGGCGAGLGKKAVEVGVDARQVFDIPKITVKVVKHQVILRRRGCGVISTGAAPAGATAVASYGANVAVICTYLYAGQFLSKARTADALAELFGTPLSAGTVASLSVRMAGDVRVCAVLKQIRASISAAEVAHFD
jgi:transposase